MITPSKQALAEAQPKLQFEDKYADYEHPPLNLLTNPIEIQRHVLSDEALARPLLSATDNSSDSPGMSNWPGRCG